MEDIRFTAALSGLLHDIGKLEQRARDDPWKPAGGTEMEGQQVHATWTMEFIQTCLPKAMQKHALPGAYHHHPEKSAAQNKSLSYLVALADKLSAGERADLEDGQSKGSFPQQMVSIFDRIALPGSDQGRKAEHFLPLQGLRLDQGAIFPNSEKITDPVSAYTALRDEMRAAAKQEIPNREVYLEHLLSAMQRTTWCAPSAYYHSIPDVSLYDHSRTTAALAVCLSELGSEAVEQALGAVTRSFQGKDDASDAQLLAQTAALLVGGDISGIQRFIYTLSSKHAAKTLRGRSFYLQLLTEAVLRYVLGALDLPYTNVIYSGGGHFFVLAPVSAREKLPEIRKAVSRKLMRHHGIQLYLALGASEVPFSGFRRGRFPEHWDEMHRRLALAKQQRYIELDDEMYPLVFEPRSHGGNQDQFCAVCGTEHPQTRDLESAEPNDRICESCSSFADVLGKELPHARFVALGLGEPVETLRGTAMDALAEFGLRLAFLINAREEIRWLGKGAAPGKTVLWALGDEADWPKPELPTAEWRHYSVNFVPEMTFDDLQQKSDGIKRLGVLRMDVDNLGRIFKEGFGEQAATSHATLARLSTLSFQMALFFEGWVKALVESPDYAGQIYAVYAGGDDVFLIGPWNHMPDLALRIVEDFRRFTGDNPDLHLSGGMAFIHGKYPVYQAADDAGDAEKMAKAVPGKNAFSFLGQAWKWADFATLQERKDRLVELDQQGASKSLLQLIQSLAQQEAEKRNKRNEKRVWGPWMWRGDYFFTRIVGQAKPPLKASLESLHYDIRQQLYSGVLNWGKAARWAQLQLRKEKLEKE